jgi:hypothetical protein
MKSKKKKKKKEEEEEGEEKRKLFPDFHTCTLIKGLLYKTELLWYCFQEVVGNFRNLCWCSLNFTRKPESIWKVRVCTDSLEISSKSTPPDG